MINKMRPIHFGEILKDELAELDLSVDGFFSVVNIPANSIRDILNN